MASRGSSHATARAPLSGEELRLMDAWWRACNYLAVGMVYLRANPLLREPLKPEHIKYRLLGHWGTSPELVNQIDRFDLVIDVIDRVPGPTARAAHLKEEMKNAIIDSLSYAHTEGRDRPEITNWVWPG